MIRVHLRDMRDIHKGETIIACGTGPSILDFHRHEEFLTVGANDIGRHFSPDYLTFIDSPKAIRAQGLEPKDRWPWIRDYDGHVFHQSKRRALDEMLTEGEPLRWSHLTVHEVRSIERGADGIGPWLWQSNHSGFAAIMVAIWLGAARVGTIGVDFSQDHNLHHTRERADRHLRYLCAAAQDVEIVNLSPVSCLESLPFRRLEDL